MATMRIENFVASTSLDGELDLQAITLALDGAEYEPEQSSGSVYRIREPKTATQFFRSGRVVCTGAKNPEDLVAAVDGRTEELDAAGLLK